MSTMTIKNFVQTVKLLPANISVLVRGPHGIGKSQIIRQIHEEMSKEMPFIDRRLSQLSEGDIIGLPSIKDGSTKFNPPDWYKKACETPCTLCLDEVNRASNEVLQAAFQIFLDRELNGWKLHPETRIFGAVNASEEYNVNEMDPALLDRFWTVDLLATVEDWLDWAKGKIDPLMMDFIKKNPEFLDPPSKANLNEVHTSRRSIERLDDVLSRNNLYDDIENEMVYSISVGFIGTEGAIKLMDFMKNDAKTLSGKDIMEKYTVSERVRNLVKSPDFGQDNLASTIDKAVRYIEGLEELSQLNVDNLKAFIGDIPDELKVSMWQTLTKDDAPHAKEISDHITEMVLEVFLVEEDEV